MDIYLILVIALLILAIGDLVVGVSNDAVNFLTSAIGSRVATQRTILIIAAAGVFAGAAFSSGMMEVARKGIFNPSFFSFADVMIIFMAVMITDIILLDAFNSFGMPTSTTVSIVFELLGASVMVGWLMLRRGEHPELELLDLINTSKAGQIIAGIFISIGVAFSVGALSQWVSRLWFTFNIRRGVKKYGALFAGICMTIIIYFLVIKGIKGAQFGGDISAFFMQNALLIVVGSFLFSTIVLFALQRLFEVNPLKIVVLAGTFALAMAFAGNDLVNFIGVPITGYQSYNMWQDSGLAAEAFSMSSLAEAVRTPKELLFIAGLIMVVTLWFSAKARKVTDTSVKLGSQGAVDERFKPNLISSGIISVATGFSNFFTTVVPNRTLERIDARFKFEEVTEKDRPAFDLLRAAVNLVIASILIAFASSLKLPLSTTYVSFMVAMGASLADRAWGAGSAPYRVAGVVNVIGGWFLTAIVAFAASALIALLINMGGNWVAVGLFVVALAALLHSNRRKK
ncbi:inorganic phosphate transporter [Croceimicrobium sp.]|uniref:inorganic phosphate transporter n=1 Tax=Croceimicrobium sp. TaxID=2828340 RepID=UPI003BAD8AA2